MIAQVKQTLDGANTHGVAYFGGLVVTTGLTLVVHSDTTVAGMALIGVGALLLYFGRPVNIASGP